jgi:peptide deformylase
MIRPVLKVPHSMLLRRSVPVEFKGAGSSVGELLDSMYETMKAERGIGLAAIQVGVPLRVAVIEVDGVKTEFVNPKIASRSMAQIVVEEGCLSVPGARGLVQRPRRIVVDALKRDGEPFQVTLSDLSAVCAQHEFDHMDGTLFISKVLDRTA